MAAPDYVPVPLADQPRKSLPLPPPRRWTATRPADLQGGQPRGPRLGSPGPDQGYALFLAHRMEDRLRLTEHEHVEDVIAGAVALALKRTSLLGRAPTGVDLEVAFALFGFLTDNVPADLVQHRRRLFAGGAHDYWHGRKLADSVPPETLMLSPKMIEGKLATNWRSLLTA